MQWARSISEALDLARGQSVDADTGTLFRGPSGEAWVVFGNEAQMGLRLHESADGYWHVIEYAVRTVEGSHLTASVLRDQPAKRNIAAARDLVRTAFAMERNVVRPSDPPRVFTVDGRGRGARTRSDFAWLAWAHDRWVDAQGNGVRQGKTAASDWSARHTGTRQAWSKLIASAREMGLLDQDGRATQTARDICFPTRPGDFNDDQIDELLAWAEKEEFTEAEKLRFDPVKRRAEARQFFGMTDDGRGEPRG